MGRGTGCLLVKALERPGSPKVRMFPLRVAADVGLRLLQRRRRALDSALQSDD